ncbi:MAG: ABC transporter substrate-binding protein [Candidatus Competibacterales bacterium]|nr:ABC transporter substrate-binding protein [Candidatus Competibacterales bacterium]
MAHFDIPARATLLAFATALTATSAQAGHEQLTITSWGGAYTASQMQAYVNPFREQVDVSVEVVDYNGGLDEIRNQVRSLNVIWDVVDVGLADALRGCQEGLLEPIDPAILAPAPDGTAATGDFLPGMLQRCAVGQNVFSTVIGYDPADFDGDPPASVQDFFDLRAFPGRRGVRRDPQVILEWATMAAGVPADEVYPTLATDAGLARAFAQLDRIKAHIVWWENAAEPPQLLADNEVSMTQSYNGRLQDAIEAGDPGAILWDGQILDTELWAIVKGTPHLDRALEFVAFATTPDRQAEQSRHIAYGPARRSSMAMLESEYLTRLPTAPDNDLNSLQADSAWWAEHMAEIEPVFEAWIERDIGLQGPSGSAL